MGHLLLIGSRSPGNLIVILLLRHCGFVGLVSRKIITCSNKSQELFRVRESCALGMISARACSFYCYQYNTGKVDSVTT